MRLDGTMRDRPSFGRQIWSAWAAKSDCGKSGTHSSRVVGHPVAIGTDKSPSQLESLGTSSLPRITSIREPPTQADRYRAILAGEIWSGPAYTFPASSPFPSNVEPVDNLQPLLRHFTGWTEDELPERSPILAIFDADAAVSVCFCARRSPFAAEAGVETAPSYRGRGLAAMVTRAWVASIQRRGLIPIYSTSWDNAASLAVARKLDLVPCAQIWSIVAPTRP